MRDDVPSHTRAREDSGSPHPSRSGRVSAKRAAAASCSPRTSLASPRPALQRTAFSFATPDSRVGELVTATATGPDGKSEFSEAVVVADATAPDSPVITSPADGSYDADGRLAFAGTAEAGSRVELFEEGENSPVVAATTGPSGA